MRRLRHEILHYSNCETSFYMDIYIDAYRQSWYHVWEKGQISIREMTVTVSYMYVLMVSGDSCQSLSLVKIQKGSSELHCKLSLAQCFSVGLEILKQNFKFIPFLLEAFGFTNELVNFAGTGLFNIEKLVVELSGCSKDYASWTWCTWFLAVGICLSIIHRSTQKRQKTLCWPFYNKCLENI